MENKLNRYYFKCVDRKNNICFISCKTSYFPTNVQDYLRIYNLVLFSLIDFAHSIIKITRLQSRKARHDYARNKSR